MKLLLATLLFAISYAQTVIENGKEVTLVANQARCGSSTLIYSDRGIPDFTTCAQIAQDLDENTMYFSFRGDRGKCDIPSPDTMTDACTTDVQTGLVEWKVYQIADPALPDDVCGVPGGDGTSCLGCDGVPNSELEFDVCGVCGGDGTGCDGCDGVAGSGAVEDECGVCGGDGSSCAPVCTDTAGLRTDADGYDCEHGYDSSPADCGLYDDDDFVAGELCCACGGGSLPTGSPGDDCFPYVQPMCHIQKILADDEGSETDKETRFDAVGRHVKRVLRTNMMDDGSKPQAKWMWRQMKDIVKFEGYSRRSFWRLNKQFENLVAWYNDNMEISAEENLIVMG